MPRESRRKRGLLPDEGIRGEQRGAPHPVRPHWQTRDHHLERDLAGGGG